MKVLAIGECMAELAPTDNVGTLTLGFAGDTFNTAWYLARLAPEIEVSFFTACGEDTLSRDMRAFVRASGIDDTYVQTISKGTIGLYIISLDKGERSFTYWRGQSAARQLANDGARLGKAIAETDIIYFSGITLGILSPKARERLFLALRVARKDGKIVIFDPNLRPKLWASEDEMTETIMAAATVSDIALPSYEDEAEFFGDASPKDTATRYQKAGVRTVVVKNGAEPIHVCEGMARDDIAVPTVNNVVDTTAAGDSFNAQVIAGVAQYVPLKESVLAASAIASQVIQNRGALYEVTT